MSDERLTRIEAELANLRGEVRRLLEQTPLAVFRRVLAELEQDTQRPTQTTNERTVECQPEKRTLPESFHPLRPMIRCQATPITEDTDLSSSERMELRTRARRFLQKHAQPRPGRKSKGP